MDDLIKDFLVESIENLDRLDSELVKLESDPSSEILLSSIFRTIHTIKGSCGFLGFSKLEKVAHAGESLLSRLRDGKISLTAELTSGLLSMVDAIRTMLSEIRTTSQDGKEDYPDLIENLLRLQQTGNKPESKGPPKPKSPDSEKKAHIAPRKEAGVGTTADQPARQQEKMERSGDAVVASGPTMLEDAQAASRVQDESRTSDAAAETIRVDVHLLDKLMNLVGELVLTRNQITQFSARQSDPTLTSSTQQLNLLTSELQGEVMKTRMPPISNVFDKFPRVVRDVAKGCGKQVQIEMEGKETELDKSLLEAITFSAVEKPGRKIRFSNSRSLICVACCGVIRPRSSALFLTRALSIPAPSSEISMTTCPPSWQARNFK
jgi:two-component system, chemotaxis family, sensor kinase CheA